MKKQLTIYLIIIAGGLILFSSCKKNDNPQPPVSQKTYITRMAVNNIVYNYYYDNQNRFRLIEYVEPTLTQTISITGFDANNNITEYIVRTTGTTNVIKYNATFDAQNRLNTVEVRDSINPTTYTLKQTVTYTYPTGKTIRTTTTPAGASTRIEYTFNGDENITEQKSFNASGINIVVVTYSAFDNKNTPESLMPHMVKGGIDWKNNITAYTNTNLGGATNYTATYIYNADNYPTQATYTGGAAPVVYTYTYEKR